MAGCAGPTAPATFDLGAANRVFAVGYQDIYDLYIEPVDMGELAVNGLNGLKEIDPALEIGRSGGKIQLVLGQIPVRAFDSPDPGDTDGWAALSAGVIAAARRFSQPLDNGGAEEIYEAVFKAALSGLDGHSRYASADAAQDYRAMREGFGGIGIKPRFDGQEVKVAAVLPDTPADRSDLKIGDLITHIDGVPAAGRTRKEVIRQLRGQVGSRVSLTVNRRGVADPIIVRIKRALIIPPMVHFERKGNIAYLRITGFNLNTAYSLAHALKRAQGEMGPELKGIVMDLRNNPGGLLEEAVGVADVFLASGRIVSTRGRHPDSQQLFEAGGGDLAGSLPLVVLVNGRSASAPEIVAAALQDRGRAVLVGTNSYGKGTVQNITRLPNDGELILTWSRMHAPSGYSWHRLGLLPTICTSLGGDDAAEILEKLRRGLLRTAVTLAAWRAAAGGDQQKLAGLRKACPREESKRDIDLDLALQLLADRRLYAQALELSAAALPAP